MDAVACVVIIASRDDAITPFHLTLSLRPVCRSHLDEDEVGEVHAQVRHTRRLDGGDRRAKRLVVIVGGDDTFEVLEDVLLLPET